MCAPRFLCVLVSRPVCTCTSAQLRWNITGYLLCHLTYFIFSYIMSFQGLPGMEGPPGQKGNPVCLHNCLHNVFKLNNSIS